VLRSLAGTFDESFGDAINALTTTIRSESTVFDSSASRWLCINVKRNSAVLRKALRGAARSQALATRTRYSSVSLVVLVSRFPKRDDSFVHRLRVNPSSTSQDLIGGNAQRCGKTANDWSPLRHDSALLELSGSDRSTIYNGLGDAKHRI